MSNNQVRAKVNPQMGFLRVLGPSCTISIYARGLHIFLAFSGLMAGSPDGIEPTAGCLADAALHSAGQCLLLKLFLVLRLGLHMQVWRATDSVGHESDSFCDFFQCYSWSIGIILVIAAPGY